ncbi:protein of unknown function [Methylocella tundrae]|uniref:Peptidase n=1 Tax=Methylocella tundrae TaxID=227605 RepID=A0A4U8Z555_METTU|nr:protein of unknown function [Methylocella tundrae]
MKKIAPYGTWTSPVTTDLMTAAAISLGGLTVDGETLYWLEGRPTENGRTALLRRRPDGVIEELTRDPINVGSRVHEYGGGAFGVQNGVIVFSERRDGSVWVIEPRHPPRKIATPDGCRYADFELDLPRRRVLAVREDHRERSPTDPEAAIVALDLDAAAETVLVKGPDFLSSPRLSPDGQKLAWIAWDHPHMPWDETRLYCAGIKDDGALAAPEMIAGAEPEAIVQPGWSAANILHFSSDRTGWWNLYAHEGGRDVALCPVEAEMGGPHWVFRQRFYAFLKSGGLIASLVQGWRQAHGADHGGRIYDARYRTGRRISTARRRGPRLYRDAADGAAGDHAETWLRSARPPRQSGRAFRSAVRDRFDRRGDYLPDLARAGSRFLVCAEKSRFRRTRGRFAASRRPVAWRPDQHDDQSFQLADPVVDQPRHRRRRRELWRIDRLWARLSPPPQWPVGHCRCR